MHSSLRARGRGKKDLYFFLSISQSEFWPHLIVMHSVVFFAKFGTQTSTKLVETERN